MTFNSSSRSAGYLLVLSSSLASSRVRLRRCTSFLFLRYDNRQSENVSCKKKTIWISFYVSHYGQRTFSSQLYRNDLDLILQISSGNSFDKIFYGILCRELYDPVSSTDRTENLVDDTRRLVCCDRQSDKTNTVKIHPFKSNPLVGSFVRSKRNELSQLIVSSFSGIHLLTDGHLTTSDSLQGSSWMPHRASSRFPRFITIRHASSHFSTLQRRSRRNINSKVGHYSIG